LSLLLLVHFRFPSEQKTGWSFQVGRNSNSGPIDLKLKS
jgi:hypothetical protein